MSVDELTEAKLNSDKKCIELEEKNTCSKHTACSVGVMGSRISVAIQFGSSTFPIEDLSSNTKIVTLKREIFQYTGIFINNQILKLMGRVLEDAQTLVECGVRTAAIIELTERAEDSRKIFIESTNKNNLMTLDYDPNDTVLNIKNHFLRDLNIPIERQKLYFTTVLLQDGEKLSKYKIEEGTKLTLEVTQLNPNCFMVEMPNGHILDLDYEADLTIDNLKQTISCKAGDIQAEQMRLYFKEEQLESRTSLSRCNVKVGDTLKLKLREGEEIVIFIDAPTGRREMRNLTLEKTIADIKCEIKKVIDIPIERQTLYFEDKRLPNGSTLLQAGVEDGSRITLDLEVPVVMKIYVNFNSRNIEIEVEPKSTILELKQIIEGKTEVKVKVQKLIFAGKLLEDSKQLSFYEIQKEHVLHLIQQYNTEEIHIIIKTNNNSEYPIPVLPDTLISEIKEEISLRERGTPDQYQLTFSGTILTDESTVSNYEIRDESVLHMELMRDDTAPAKTVRMRSRSNFSVVDPRNSARLSVLYNHPEDEPNISADLFQALPSPRVSDKGCNLPHPVIPLPISSPRVNTSDIPVNEYIPDPELYFLRTRYQEVAPPNYFEFRSPIPVETISHPAPYVRDVMSQSYKIVNSSLPLPEAIETEISVRVNILCDGEYTFKFSDKATIRDVKKKVQSERGFKPECKVYFQDTLCEDTRTLADIGIVQQSVLTVDLLYGWNVSIGQCQMVVGCYAKSNIGDIKKCICKKQKIDTEKQRLYLGEIELRNEQSLLEYQPGANLKFILELNSNISIIFSSGRTFTLSSSRKLTGKSIKQQIMGNFKVPIENQTLTYLGKEIKNELTLDAVKFREENHIAVQVDSERSKLITVLVRLSTGDQRIVKVHSLETVGKIKSLIHDTNHKLIDYHGFMNRDSDLSDENVLEYYGIRNYDEIRMFSDHFKVVNVTLLDGITEVVCLKAQTQEDMLEQMRNQCYLPPEYNRLFFDKKRDFRIQDVSPGDNLYLGYEHSMIVSIASSSSRTFQILVNRDDRVIALKRKIEMKEQIPTSVQELFCNGMPMNDDNASIGELYIITLRIKESADNYITIYLTDEANNTVDLNEVNKYDRVNKLFDSLVSIGYTVQGDALFVFRNIVLHPDAPLCCYGVETGNDLWLINRSTPDCLSWISEKYQHRPRSDRRNLEQRSRGKTEYNPPNNCFLCNRVKCVCVRRPHSETYTDDMLHPGAYQQGNGRSAGYTDYTCKDYF